MGVLASGLLLVARLIQGLAHGGEVASSYTYVAEMAPPKRRGLWSSSLYVFVTIGVLAASLLGAGLSAGVDQDAMATWGWRVPFLVGGLLGLYAMYLRRNLPETQQFERVQVTGRRRSISRGGGPTVAPSCDSRVSRSVAPSRTTPGRSRHPRTRSTSGRSTRRQPSSPR